MTPAAEGQAAALAPGDDCGEVVQAAGELGKQAALADARLADDQGKAGRTPRDRVIKQGLQAGKLLLAADERRGEAAQLRAGSRQGGSGDPGSEGFGLALERDGMAGLEGEDLLGGGVGGLTDGDGHGRRGALQAGGRVDGVAGEKALAGGGIDVQAHQGLPGVDADPDLNGLAADAGQGVDLVDEAQAGSHGAFGVVLVQGGYAENRHHGVADELLHRAAVGLDGLAGD